MRRYLLLCVSAANLVFLPAWIELQRFRAESPREVRSEAGVALFAATLGSVLTLAGVLYGAVWAARRWGGSRLWMAAQCGFLVLLITPLDEAAWQAYAVLRGKIPDGVLIPAWSLLLVVPLLGCLLNAVYGRKAILRAAGGAAMVLAPLLPVAVVDGVRSYVTAPPRAVEARGSAAPAAGTRVVWIVFDELDQRLAFEERPESIAMPEFDRLREVSFYAPNTKPPAWDTPESMGSLVTGRRVEKFEPGMLQGPDTVFARSGVPAAVAGWHLPYCDALAGKLVSCAEPTPAVLRPADVGSAAARLWNDQYDRHWLVTRFSGAGQFRTPWFGWGELRDQLAGFRYLKDRAAEAAADPAVRLALLHLPVPHPHGIYNRRTDELSLDRGNNYLDNLELADRALGDVRRALRESGLERRTILVVSSDHPWRPDVWNQDTAFTDEEREFAKAGRTDRIPFFVHFPEQPRGLVHGARLDSVASAEMIGELLRGGVKSPVEVEGWLAGR